MLLNHLFNEIKDENLVSGFRGTWICHLNEGEVFKRLNNLDHTITESAEKFLGGSVVRVLQETLCVSNDQQKNVTKKKEEKLTQERWW